MKKRTEKPSVDDLFARKLSNMSLPPNPDGFARLRTRMGQSESRIKRVFWQNPTNQRYMAVAVCLLVVCLFGWLYLSIDAPVSGKKATVATNKPRPLPVPKQAEWKSTPNQDQVAATRSSLVQKMSGRISPQPTGRASDDFSRQALDKSATTGSRQPIAGNLAVNDKRIVSQTVPSEQVAKPIPNTPPVGPASEPQIAAATANPAPIAERVLVVTIAEPEALVAARQAVKQSTEGKETAALADKPGNDSKAASFWQQVKRVKQGEIFARKDAADDDRGLLLRAYSGLKQTFDKDKSAKQ